jgi:two-component system cell cycle response regulator
VTTDAAGGTGSTAVLGDVRPASVVAATLTELEGRRMSRFRSIAAPAEAAERRAADLGDTEMIMRARLLRAGVMLREGRTEEGGRIVHRVHAWADRHAGRYLQARSHRELATFYRQVGDVATALIHAVACVSHLDDDAPAAIRARHLLALAVVLDDNGSAEEADRRFREALDIATAIGDDELALYILNNMAYTAYEHGDEPAAAGFVAHMRIVQARSGDHFAANDLDTIARVELMTGRYAAVERTLRPVVDAGHGAGPVLANEGDALAECMLTLAEARRLDGRYGDAQDMIDAALIQCTRNGLAAVRARVREEQAALYAATGCPVSAYEEHRAFHAEATALHSAQREARARAMQAVFEATEARRSSDHFREMAHRDALTGLHNRRYVNERLPALLGEAAVGRTPLSVALVDLDHFKRINDTLSHETGDTVLEHVAALLTASAGDTGIAARMGGEEFLLIMPGAATAEAELHCERLRMSIAEHLWRPVTGDLPVTTSIGVSTTDDGRGTPSALLSQADRNLYTAKRTGRDRVVADQDTTEGR